MLLTLDDTSTVKAFTDDTNTVNVELSKYAKTWTGKTLNKATN